MNLEAGVSLGQLLLALGVVIATGGMAWGALLQRVKTLEKEVETLSGFSERLARIETGQAYIQAEVGKITGSWLFKEPPGYEALAREPGSRR